MRKVYKGTLPPGTREWSKGDMSAVQKESVGHQAGLSCQSRRGSRSDIESWGTGSGAQARGEQERACPAEGLPPTIRRGDFRRVGHTP